ncbi:MAG TPA: arginine--tRNA ligase [Burkholderiales bacterium]|nr:arginine--tRNA ligase [Burkholderiales bacterium]
MSEHRPADARSLCAELLGRALDVAWPDAAIAGIVIDRPKDPQHGDYACNVALQLARALKRPPRDIAQAIVEALPPSPYVAKAEIAGAGFINLFLKPSFKQGVVTEVLAQGERYGRSALGRRKKVQVEFVSANPTGPLHVGHGRGAAYGASLANLLEAAGFDVAREYYVNDAGRQMDILALSTWLRYLEASGASVDFPPNAYRGEYVRDMARALRGERADRYTRAAAEITHGIADTDPEARLDALIARAKELLGPLYAEVHAYALEAQLADCRADLTEFGVVFDNWFSERSLMDSGRVDDAIARLSAAGHVYENDGAKWFRSTAFGDEKDRVVQRENGQYTYFASDIAYHADKFARGFDIAIDVWGADHHGYIARVKGALEALGLNREQLTVALVQFAVLYRHGEKVSMSTRAGEFVTLRELRAEVGNDAARFFYVMRKSDQHLDFDLDLAKSQTNENPVYYVQYAHARVCSVHEQWGGDASALAHADASPLTSEHERALLDRLMAYAETVETAARELAPHAIAFYLRELAAEFHSYYNATRILVPEEPVKLARLALATAVRQVLSNGLGLLGVSAPVKMVKID